MTVSQLWVGVVRENTADQRAMQSAFVEHLMARIPVLEFSLSVACTHARMMAALPTQLTGGAHDALIAATATHHGLGLLTRNVADFKVFAGLQLEVYTDTTQVG